MIIEKEKMLEAVINNAVNTNLSESKILQELQRNQVDDVSPHSKSTGHCKFSRSGGGHGNVCYVR